MCYDSNHSYFLASYSTNSSLYFKKITYDVEASKLLGFIFFIAGEKLTRLKLLINFLLTFRVGPQGKFNDPFFLPSIVDYKIYIHLTLHKMNPLIIT